MTILSFKILPPTFLFLALLSLPAALSAQGTTEVTVTLNDEVKVYGRVPSNKFLNGPHRRFTMITADGKKVKIKAADAISANFGRTLYEVFPNESGTPTFMLRIADGPKIILYREIYTTHNQNIGFIVVTKYYILRGNRPQFIDHTNLKAFPQVYFPGDEALCETIRNTRLKDFDISGWVTHYNSTD